MTQATSSAVAGLQLGISNASDVPGPHSTISRQRSDLMAVATNPEPPSLGPSHIDNNPPQDTRRTVRFANDAQDIPNNDDFLASQADFSRGLPTTSESTPSRRPPETDTPLMIKLPASTTPSSSNVNTTGASSGRGGPSGSARGRRGRQKHPGPSTEELEPLRRSKRRT